MQNSPYIRMEAHEFVKMCNNSGVSTTKRFKAESLHVIFARVSS